MNNTRKLGRIIGVKERIRKVRQSELHEAKEAVRVADESHTNAVHVQRTAANRLTARGETTGDELARRAMIVAMADRGTSRAKAVLDDRLVEQDRRSDAMIAASREVRVLETLETRIETRLDREARVREQAQNDDTTSARRARGTQ